MTHSILSKPGVWENKVDAILSEGKINTRLILYYLILFSRKRTFFELTESEINNYPQILAKCKTDLLDQDPLISGFNLEFNDRVDAGQTVMHCRVHIIPRRSGDTKNLRGFVSMTIYWDLVNSSNNEGR